MRAGRSILSVSRAAVDLVNFSVRRNLLVETGWRPDCISQPGSPVSTTQHVKAAYEQSTVGQRKCTRLPPPPRRMEFSEATPVSRCATRPCTVWLGS
jgi:hypothetical protein